MSQLDGEGFHFCHILRNTVNNSIFLFENTMESIYPFQTKAEGMILTDTLGPLCITDQRAFAQLNSLRSRNLINKFPPRFNIHLIELFRSVKNLENYWKFNAS